MSIWTCGGKIIVSESGKPIECDYYPCAEPPAVVPCPDFETGYAPEFMQLRFGGPWRNYPTSPACSNCVDLPNAPIIVLESEGYQSGVLGRGCAWKYTASITPVTTCFYGWFEVHLYHLISGTGAGYMECDVQFRVAINSAISCRHRWREFVGSSPDGFAFNDFPLPYYSNLSVGNRCVPNGNWSMYLTSL